jgi:hypothetical protein
MCVPAFAFGPVLILLGRFVPSWAGLVELPLKPLCPANAGVVAPVLLLPLIPIRGVCERLNGTVTMQIAINPTLIDVI